MISQCEQKSAAIDEKSREQFADILPRLQDQIEYRFRRFKSELKEELSAEATAIAFQMFVRLVRRNQADRASASSLAEYACRQVRAGRRCGSSLNVRDMTSRHCQKRKPVEREPFGQRNHATAQWEELVVEDRRASPADVAATRIDFRDWLKTLSRKKRRIAEVLAGGESTGAAAKRFRVSQGRISQLRRELMEAWEAFQGAAIPNAA